MHPVGILILKELHIRKRHWVYALAEICIPISLIIIVNSIPFPESNFIDNEFLNETITETCSREVDIFTPIIYHPETPFTKSLMKNVKCRGHFGIITPGNPDKISVLYKIGVKFLDLPNDVESVPSSLSYELYPTQNYWGDIFNLWNWSPKYTYSSQPLKRILKLKHAMDDTYLRMRNIQTPKISFRSIDLFSRETKIYNAVVILAFVLILLLMVPSVVSSLVHEKTTGAKELLLVMGVRRWHLWAAKFITTMTFVMFTQSVVVTFLYVPLNDHSNVLDSVPPFLTWFYLVYSLSSIVIFLFFMSCFFSNSMIAVFISVIFWGLSYIIFAKVSFSDLGVSKDIYLALCLLPSFSFFSGLSILLDFNYYDKEVKFGEVLSGSLSHLSLSDVMYMTLVNILLYSALTWYTEQVLPGQYGIAKPMGFFLKRSYWFPKRGKTESIKRFPDNRREDEDYEPVPAGLKIGISVRNVTKEYQPLSKNSVRAVDDVSIDFYAGEITTLLGHNGAGKSSLFNVVSGMIPATSGDVEIDGYNVAGCTEEARGSFGLCPQHNMLYGDLDVLQNLTFYGMVKGLTRQQAVEEAKHYIQKLKLEDVKECRASVISGGQKRKVSMAIALIGGSKVLLLDEPTSGLDPEIRREIWELLLELRGSRTVLLTTHFMEEADAVSDRIAIMDHGRVRCYGTPMYLKSKYGSGYILSVVLGKSADASFVEHIKGLVAEYVTGSRFRSLNGSTLNFQLASDGVELYPTLFSKLNNLQDVGDIESCSVTFSTFDDVFIRIRGTTNDDQGVDTVDTSPYHRLMVDEKCVTKVSPPFLPLYQFYALLIKKLIFLSRNIFLYLLFLFVPTFLIVLDYKILPHLRSVSGIDEVVNISDVINISPELYRGSLALYSTTDENKLARSVVDILKGFNVEVRQVADLNEGIYEIYMENFTEYEGRLSMGADFSSDSVDLVYNRHAVHSLLALLTTVYNGLLRAENLTGVVKTTLNMAYSHIESQETERYISPSFTCFPSEVPNYIGLHVLFYLYGPVKERLHGARQLQLMMTSSVTYWLSHLVFDAFFFAAYTCVSLTLIMNFHPDEILSNNLDAVASALILWIIGLLLLTYVLSCFVRNTAVGSLLNIFLYITYTYPIYNLVKLKYWRPVHQYFHPSSIFKLGMDSICTSTKEENQHILALFLYCIVLFLFLLAESSYVMRLIFHRFLTRIICVRYPEQRYDNDDVENQAKHVNDVTSQSNFTSNSLVVKGLRRWYLSGFRPRTVVKGISFAVESGECFGLLGVNGAGKTTSFRMMTRTITTSDGQIYINGYRLHRPTEGLKGLRLTGYCPQYDGIIPTFRGREMLALFARLRGVYGGDVEKEAEGWITQIGLMNYENTPVEKYSGGNLRKLSIALAVIGDPPVVVLDEPTSGVDPINRRLVWKIISDLRKAGKSIVLTSHSMDECEAVCTRLAIMVDGRFRCYGTITNLKETFGQGFTIQLRIREGTSPSEYNHVKNQVVQEFNSYCSLTYEHLNIMEWQIKQAHLRWDDIFTKLLKIKSNLSILECFSASATSLEQIFISFARESD